MKKQILVGLCLLAAQLTFAQEIKVDGAIIISTPQEIALLDVKRGIKMFDKLGYNPQYIINNLNQLLELV